MHKLITTFLLFSLCSCDFDKPITETPKDKLDSRLIGHWIAKDGDDTIHVLITKMDDSHYSGKTWENSATEKADNFTAWPSIISDDLFLTVDTGPNQNKRYIYSKLAFKKDASLSYQSVSSESAFAKDGNGTIEERLKKHLKDKDLFRETIEFRKKSDPRSGN